MVAFGRWLLRHVLRLAYGVRVTGLEHYAAAGRRVLIVANHTSFLDAALLAAFLPDRLTFAVNTEIAKRWWMKPLLSIVDAFPLNPTNPYSLKSLTVSGAGCRFPSLLSSAPTHSSFLG